MLQHREAVAFKALSILDTTRAFGHKSALDLAGSSYSSFAYATSSFSYDTSTWSTAAHVVIGFNTLLKDLEAKGIVIKA